MTLNHIENLIIEIETINEISRNNITLNKPKLSQKKEEWGKDIIKQVNKLRDNSIKFNEALKHHKLNSITEKLLFYFIPKIINYYYGIKVKNIMKRIK